jgi:Diacylglycerol kinase accessory domain
MKSTKAMETDRKDNMIFSIKSKYKGLVCLNSTSYIAGLRNVWKTKAIATETPNKEFQPQTVGDGNVEFVAFKNELALGL